MGAPTSAAPPVEAVVFDLDGVLLDSEQLWDEVRRGVAASAGIPWPDEATTAVMGMSTAEWSAYLVNTVGVPGTAGQVAAQVVDGMAARYAEDLPLLPGAVDAVRRLGRRWPPGLASSSPRSLIDVVLATTGLEDDFSVTLSTEQVAAGKPSPFVSSQVVAALGSDPARTVAEEDSSNGLRSAAAAGLVVLALPHPAFPPAADALTLAEGRVDSRDSLTVELVESVAGRRLETE
jgi:HAD superfamily hydrolase (TIGR01509 family)